MSIVVDPAAWPAAASGPERPSDPSESLPSTHSAAAPRAADCVVGVGGGLPARRGSVPGRDGLRTIRVGLLGLGYVGQAFVRAAREARDTLAARGLCVEPVGALVRHVGRQRALDGASVPLTDDPAEFRTLRYDVVVEALGGAQPAGAYIRAALSRAIPVVTANKSVLAAEGEQLAALAARHGAAFRYEAAVIAGVPFLGTLARRPLAARVRRLSGIVNSTSNYILSLIDEEGHPWLDALRRAQALGLAEPDPGNDTRGTDAAEKLIVLLREIGVRELRVDDLETTGIETLDAPFLSQARRFGGTIRPVIEAQIEHGSARAFVGPAFLHHAHPLAGVRGESNAIRLDGPFVRDLVYTGPGAGPDVTAASILDDVVEVADDRHGLRLEALVGNPGALDPASRNANAGVATPSSTTANATPGLAADASRSPRRCPPPLTAWFLRLQFASAPPPPEALCERFAAAGVWLRQSSSTVGSGAAGQFVDGSAGSPGGCFHALTHPCPREPLEAAIAAISRHAACVPLSVRVLES
jgi:homoserine dehydrogenase